MILKKIKNNYVLIIVSILALSFLMTIFLSWENTQYKNRIGKISIYETENIKGKNYSNLDILQKSVTLGEINNAELMKLINNCNSIEDSITNLNDDYYFYKQKSLSVFSKGTNNKEDSIKNNLYNRTSEFFYGILDGNMKEKKNSIKITNDLERDFKILVDLSNDIDKYYKEFEEKELQNAKDEAKEKKMIKEMYWIDILEGVEEITLNYRDTEFKTLKARVILNN